MAASEAANETDILMDAAAATGDSAAGAAKNVTERIPSTPEGMAIAYSSLVVMALLPIFFGAFRSVRYHREQKVTTPI